MLGASWEAEEMTTEEQLLMWCSMNETVMAWATALVCIAIGIACVEGIRELVR